MIDCHAICLRNSFLLCSKVKRSVTPYISLVLAKGVDNKVFGHLIDIMQGYGLTAIFESL